MSLFKKVAQKYGITVEQASNLRSGMESTWDVISDDWFSGWGDEDPDDWFSCRGEMIAEATIDAHRILAHTNRTDVDLSWVYKFEDGTNILELGKDVWNA